MILDRFRLTDKVAIVTGAGRGIGAATARAFAEAGANVTLCSRTQEQLDAVAADVKAAGREALTVACDVSDLDSLRDLVGRTVETFGRIDVVVNNVGGTLPRPFLDTTPEIFEEAIHFNVTTALELSRTAAPVMLEGDGGAIVNISSTMGRLSDRGYLAYGTAKAALAHMTRLMAADLAPRIRANAIAVGSTATSALDVVLTNDALHDEMVSKTPLKRLGDPDDIALGVLYLASDAGSYITGKVLEIDGGIETPNLDLRLPDL